MTQPSSAMIGARIARSSSSGVSVQPGPWTSASSSTKRTPRRAARARPTVVLPLPLAEAMIATRRTPRAYLSADQPHRGAAAVGGQALEGLGRDVSGRPDLELLALLARPPQRHRGAVVEDHAGVRDRGPDLLAPPRVGDQRLTVAGEQER